MQKERCNLHYGMKMKKYVLNRLPKLENNGGSKAMNDCLNISKKIGFEEISFYGKKKYFSYLKLMIIPKESVLLVQHPLRLPSKYGKLLRGILKLKKIKVIAIIHDLEILRNVYINDESEEIAWLKFYDKIIVHNNNMKKFILDKFQFKENDIEVLQIFDYLIPSSNKRNENIDIHSLVVAGNLSKERAGYIYNLKDLQLNHAKMFLYGFGYENKDVKIPQVKYMGVVNAEEIPEVVSKYGWGIAWDGTSLNSCEGNAGKYLHFINQHRISLYLAAGIPVITWENSGLADFIKTNDVGICVNSLMELEEKIANIDEKTYQEKQRNTKKIGERVRKGYYFERALINVLKRMNSEY